MANTLIMTVILLISVASIVVLSTPPSPTTTAKSPTTTAAPTTTTAAPTTTTAAPTTTTAAPTTTTTAAPTTTTAAPTTTTTAAPTTTTAAPTAAPTTTTAAPTAAPTTTTAAPTTTTAAPTTTTAAPTTTTAAPTTTTTAPTTTTAAPTTTAALTTTAAPPMTTTTADPTTMANPPTTATIATPTTTNPATPITTSATPMTTRTAPTTTTTAASTTPAPPLTTTVAGGQTTTSGPTSVCASSPCLCGSTCEEHANQTYVCLCLAGEAHGPQGCQKAKVFPGLLVWKKKFDPEMFDKRSQIFKETSDKIIDLIDKEFENKTGYMSSLVLKLRESKQSEARREAGSIEASLQIIFETTSDIREDTVREKVKNLTCASCPLPGNFTSKNLCDSNPCDSSSTTCKHTAGSFTCSCVDGYISTDYSDRLCTACRSGQKAVNNECKPCDFGRTGLNCEDERLLIVVIVSSVLGFLLVVALIALLVVVKKFKRTKQKDIRKPFQIPSLAKGPLSSNSNGYYMWLKEPVSSLANGVPQIPRANTVNNWDNLEMTLRNNEQNAPFDDNQVDMVSFSQS